MKGERVKKGGAESRGIRSTDNTPVTLFTIIDPERHAALREIASVERRSVADLVGDALDAFLAEHLGAPDS
jgi:hypothetical protein